MNTMSEQHGEATETPAQAPAPAAQPPQRAAASGPIESLDRPTLERRYRLMRNFVVLLSVLAVVLAGVSISQYVEMQRGGASATQPTAAGNGTTENPAAQTPPTQVPSGECPAPVKRDANDPMAIGDVDAPVVLVEWTDFRCPYCGVFSRDTFPSIIEEYVETGQVRIEVHDVDFIEGEVSANVAIAARAAGEQGRYFEYLAAVYDDMSDDRPTITDDLLRDYAEQAGVSDLDRFDTDRQSDELAEALRSSSEQAKALGVDSVPFFVDTTSCAPMKGAQPIEQFRQYLDAAVAGAAAGKTAGQ